MTTLQRDPGEFTLGTPSTARNPVRRLLGPAPIPWGTVVTLAALMSYADGFVVTAVQGAVGAVDRTGSPFVSWLLMSTLLLPVFVLAVLGAFRLARSRLGPTLRSARAVLATALLVVAAGSLVGTAEVAVSAAYDYSLQSAQTQTIAAAHGGHEHGGAGHAGSSSCAACGVLEQSLAADQRAARYAGRVLLVANLVGVFLVVGLRGGRLDVVPRRPRADSAGA